VIMPTVNCMVRDQVAQVERITKSLRFQQANTGRIPLSAARTCRKSQAGN
jgi:hypothetical protein